MFIKAKTMPEKNPLIPKEKKKNKARLRYIFVAYSGQNCSSSFYL